MLLGVARHPNAKIAGVGVFNLVVEVGTAIEVFDLANKVYRVAVPLGVRNKTAFAAQGIAAEQEGIIDSQIVQINEGVLGFFARKSAAYYVRNRVNAELVLNGGADSDRTRTLARMHLLKQAGFVLFKDEFLAVGCNVDEFGPKLHQAFDGAKKRIDGVALEWGQDLKTKKCIAFGCGDVVYDFHEVIRVLVLGEKGTEPTLCLGQGYPASACVVGDLIAVNFGKTKVLGLRMPKVVSTDGCRGVHGL